MSADKKALVLRVHHELFGDGNLEAVDAIFTPDFELHSPGMPDELTHGPQGMKNFAAMIRFAFSNIQIHPDDTIVDGDKVVDRWTYTGTHTGEFMGVSATGKTVSVTGIDIFQIEDGKIAEMWQNWDQMGMMRQLGASE